MAASIAELNSLLDDLQARLPQMVADYPSDGDFWSVIIAEVEVIEDKANDVTCGHVMHRINAMLAEHGRYLVGVEAIP